MRPVGFQNLYRGLQRQGLRVLAFPHVQSSLAVGHPANQRQRQPPRGIHLVPAKNQDHPSRSGYRQEYPRHHQLPHLWRCPRVHCSGLVVLAMVSHPFRPHRYQAEAHHQLLRRPLLRWGLGP